MLLGSVVAADGPINVAASVDKHGITIGDPIGVALQAALGVVVLVMLTLIVRRTRRAAGRRPKDVEMDEVLQTPAQRARAELNRVASLGLPGKGRYAEHYALLSKTLRAYVRDRFGLAAGERTPRELREDMLRA